MVQLQIFEEQKQRRVTHKVKVLLALKGAGHYGVYANVLAQQDIGGFRFSEYIRQLRQEGYHIETQRVKGNTFRYILQEEPHYPKGKLNDFGEEV